MGALFDEIEMRANVWQRARGIKPVSLCDGTEGASLEDAPPAVDVEHFIESFRLGYRELRELWTWVLPPKTIVDLSRVAKSESSAFRLSDELWALIVYDFALGYRLRSLAREHLLRSFVPLYLGWFASFVLEARALPPDAVDARVDRLAAAFEAQKSYLIARWRWPERFRT
jgi:hypothetical protein